MSNCMSTVDNIWTLLSKTVRIEWNFSSAQIFFCFMSISLIVFEVYCAIGFHAYFDHGFWVKVVKFPLTNVTMAFAVCRDSPISDDHISGTERPVIESKMAYWFGHRHPISTKYVSCTIPLGVMPQATFQHKMYNLFWPPFAHKLSTSTPSHKHTMIFR